MYEVEDEKIENINRKNNNMKDTNGEEVNDAKEGKDDIVEKFSQLTSSETSISCTSNSVKKSSKRDDCQELRNLEYKNMLMHGNNIKPKEEEIISEDTLDDFLKRETAINKLEQWTKLDKTLKISKLREYAIRVKDRYELTNDETEKLQTYLIFCLERKYFMKMKDVNYERENGKITDIPNLEFNDSARTFAYRKIDKPNSSTLKSLAPKKNRTQKA